MHVRVKRKTSVGRIRIRHLPGPHMPKCRLVYSRIKSGVWTNIAPVFACSFH
jgi:hypothetical protein